MLFIQTFEYPVAPTFQKIEPIVKNYKIMVLISQEP